MVRVFYVDRFQAFTTQIFKDLREIVSKEKNFEIFFIGPHEKDSVSWMSNHYIDGAKRIWYYGHYVRTLYSYIKKEKPDIVHISFEWRMFGPLFASLKFPILLFLLRISTKSKIIVDFRSLMIAKEDSGWKIMNDIVPFKIPRILLEVFTRIFVKSVSVTSHKIVVDSEGNKLGMIEFYGINKEKIEVNKLILPPMINTKNPEVKKRYEKQFEGKKIILCFGVISPRKSYDLIIKSFNTISDKIQNHVLVIAGLTTDDAKPYESMLHNLVKKLNLNEKVFFTGYINDEEAEILFDIAEMTLFMYRPYPESSGALFFAIHHYTPSIVTNSETFTQILAQNDAIFVEYEDQEQLSNAILKLATNEELRSELKLRLKALSERTNKKNSAIKYFELYKNMC